eukprot:16442-Heterococcus_DN1.PRE.1
MQKGVKSIIMYKALVTWHYHYCNSKLYMMYLLTYHYRQKCDYNGNVMGIPKHAMSEYACVGHAATTYATADQPLVDIADRSSQVTLTCRHQPSVSYKCSTDR